MNNSITFTTDLQCLLTDFEELVTGQDYTAGVSAVYDDPGESAIVTINFTYAGTEANDALVTAQFLMVIILILSIQKLRFLFQSYKHLR